MHFETLAALGTEGKEPITTHILVTATKSERQRWEQLNARLKERKLRINLGANMVLNEFMDNMEALLSESGEGRVG